MQYSEISLPPRVDGPPRGYFTITFSCLRLNQQTPELTQPAVKLAWWGCNEGDSDVLSIGREASAITYIINSSPEHTRQYLQDVGTLELELFDKEKGPTTVLGILKLDVHKAANGTASCICSVVCPRSGDEIGFVNVDVTLNFRSQDNSTAALPQQQLPSSSEFRDNAPDESIDEHLVPQCPQQDESIVPDEISPAAPAAAAAAAAAGIEKDLAALELQTPNVDACSVPAAPSSAIVEEALAYYAAADNANGLPEEGEQREIPEISPQHNQPAATLCIRVDSAFQLPHNLAPKGPSTQDYSMVYTTAVWQRTKEHRSSTHITSVHEVAPMGLTAVWNAQLEIEIDSNAFMDAAQRDLTSGLMDGPLLLLNVWRSGAPAPDAEQLLAAAGRGDERHPAVPTPFDDLIGCAAIDLCSLLREDSTHISGKFPLISSRHEAQGVIKATITPNEVLAAVLASTVVDTNVDATDTNVPATATATAPSAQLKRDEDPSIEIIHLEHSTAQLQQPRQPVPAASPAASVPQTFPQSLPQAKKVQYAWSGSDSDDDIGIGGLGVGMYMDGAVSCSDHEDYSEVEEEDSGVAKVPQLVTQDWLFDISRPPVDMDAPPPAEEMPVESGTALNKEAIDVPLEKKKPIIFFKNKLLPALVEYSSAPILGPSGSSVAFLPTGPSDNNTAAAAALETRPVPAPESVERIYSNPAISASQSGVSRSRNTPVVHGSGQSDEWLFGIGRPTSGGESSRGGGAPLPRSSPADVDVLVAAHLACSQFEAMSSSRSSDILKNEGKRPGSGGSSSSKTTPGSPTLTEVLHSLTSMRNNS